MKNKAENERIQAVKRYLSGERHATICTSMKKSKPWLYKWIDRYKSGDPLWFKTVSRRPNNNPTRTSGEVESAVKMIRLSLYNQGAFCGAQAIRWELEDLGVKPLPSLRTINRIISRQGLTHKRTGLYKAKGKAYPVISSKSPNHIHQADFVGPRYLKGPVRFYSLNVVDINTGRCGIHPLISRSGQKVTEALWNIWMRLGTPKNIQVDNDMVFYGSPTHPRGMGPLIRLCLHNNIEPWFIPPSEPWRNGVVEKFNNLYCDKFLRRVTMTSAEDLKRESLEFEQRHNNSYRYSKLKGMTPLKALAETGKRLNFPDPNQLPKYPIKKPESGKYHVVRFIRGNLKLNIFGEQFKVHPDLQYEYVVATVDVKEQLLKIYMDHAQVEEFKYQLR